MSVPALSDLEKLASVRFPSGNKIMFGMDFGCWEGIPADRDFYIIAEAPEQHQAFYLAARGYGVRGDYGNGSIMVKKVDLIATLATPVDSESGR